MNGIHLWTVTLILVTTSSGYFPVSSLYESYIVLSSTRSEFEYRGVVLVSSSSLFCHLFASYFWRQRLLKWFNFSSLAVNLPIPSYEFWPEFLNSEPKLARFRHFVWDLNDDIWIWWSRFLWIQRNWIWLNQNTSLDVNSSYKQTFYSQARDKMSNHSTSHVMK